MEININKGGIHLSWISKGIVISFVVLLMASCIEGTNNGSSYNRTPQKSIYTKPCKDTTIHVTEDLFSYHCDLSNTSSSYRNPLERFKKDQYGTWFKDELRGEMRMICTESKELLVYLDRTLFGKHTNVTFKRSVTSTYICVDGVRSRDPSMYFTNISISDHRGVIAQVSVSGGYNVYHSNNIIYGDYQKAPIITYYPNSSTKYKFEGFTPTHLLLE